MKIDVVIGAGWGDEGKGMTTDALAANAAREGANACVVRFNGGAQAGHTVQLDTGERHVFHHFGSGSVAGLPTHLGQRFVVNPMLFREELEALRILQANVQMTIDPRAVVTLPFDVAINQMVEKSRGSLRHGSCGVGFGETVHRNETGTPHHRLTIGQLARLTPDGLRQFWDRLALEYVPGRLLALGLDPVAPVDFSDDVFERYLEDCEVLFSNSSLKTPSGLEFNQWILEGAQGLMIDEELGVFPFVTRSKTGLPWALEFIQQLRGLSPDNEVMVWYLTRAYATRHGAGPFLESGWSPEHFEDKTNQPNDFQGSLRIAPLDVSILASSIQADLLRADLLAAGLKIIPGVSVSCLDQMGGVVSMQDGRQIPSDLFPGWLMERLGLDHACAAWGPTRETWSVLV